MSVSIADISPATPAAWDETWGSCDYATYFHSREWNEIWCAYTSGKVCGTKISFSDDRTAILPLSSEKAFKGLSTVYRASPAGTFGGWISADHLGREHASLLVDHLVQHTGNLEWRLNPYDPLALDLAAAHGKHEETQSIDLRGGFDAVETLWAKSGGGAALRKVRKARKSGVTVKLATDLSDWQRYYGVYEESCRRWGESASSRYGWELFQDMVERASAHIKLWAAYHEKNLVAGALCFYARRHVVYWHGAALDDYFSYRPVNLLMHEIAADACERGCAWLDLNPSGELEGVRAFKKSLGATSLPSPVISVETFCTKWLRGIAGSLKSILRRLDS